MYLIPQYAYGEGYHRVIKDRLKALLAFIPQEIGEVGGRAFVVSCTMGSENRIKPLFTL